MYGIGTDIVSVSRIEQALKRQGSRFPERILTDSELKDFQNLRDPERFIAKRFAAKEAFSKAIGLGMRMPMAWQRIPDIAVIDKHWWREALISMK